MPLFSCLYFCFSILWLLRKNSVGSFFLLCPAVTASRVWNSRVSAFICLSSGQSSWPEEGSIMTQLIREDKFFFNLCNTSESKSVLLFMLFVHHFFYWISSGTKLPIFSWKFKIKGNTFRRFRWNDYFNKIFFQYPV